MAKRGKVQRQPPLATKLGADCFTPRFLFTLYLVVRPQPFQRQINSYVHWKAKLHPELAETHRVLLEDFFIANRVPTATAISFEHIQAYADLQISDYFKKQVIHTIRQFVRYWIMMGLLSKEMAKIVQYDTIPPIHMGKKKHTDQMARVRALRAEGLSYRQIKALLEKRDGRKYDIHSLHRWANYKVVA